jgi:hypothetical protein
MKIVGIGLNKTGTKTLKHYLVEMGFNHLSYDIVSFEDFRAGNLSKIFERMENYDSFEDWPWSLFYKDIDRHFEDALFILTTRKSPEIWYQSLCKMAVRMGPFKNFEHHIYGYSMPHGKKKEHIDFYNKHNREVIEYFKDRPHKVLQLCWGNGDDGTKLAQFVGKPNVDLKPQHINKSRSVYSGDNWWLGHINRILFQSAQSIVRRLRKLRKSLTS